MSCDGGYCIAAEEAKAVNVGAGDECPRAAVAAPCDLEGGAWRGMCESLCLDGVDGCPPTCNRFCRSDADCIPTKPVCSAARNQVEIGDCRAL